VGAKGRHEERDALPVADQRYPCREDEAGKLRKNLRKMKAENGKMNEPPRRRVMLLETGIMSEERVQPLQREGNEISAIFVTMVRNTKAKLHK
jgi:hypothetical protein